MPQIGPQPKLPFHMFYYYHIIVLSKSSPFSLIIIFFPVFCSSFLTSLLSPSMGEGKRVLCFQDLCIQQYPINDLMKKDHQQGQDQWVSMEEEEEEEEEEKAGDLHKYDDIINCKSTPTSSSSSSIGEVSSISSSSLEDTTDDASSSSSPTSSGSLYDLSDLMAQLPIRRGLSKFYQGKSQSFTSLLRAASVEDLAKKESPYKRRMKACKSYAGGLDNYRSYTLPKPIISKKSSRSSLNSSFFPGVIRRASFVNISRPPLVPVREDFSFSFCQEKKDEPL